LQGQMKLCAKVIATTRQWLATVWASAPTTGTHLDAMLFKFTTNENRQAMLWGRKGLVGTKLGLDEDLMPAQQACKLELWPLFKEAKVAGKHVFRRVIEPFIYDIQICPPSFV
jgi:hypothetical protein